MVSKSQENMYCNLRHRISKDLFFKIMPKDKKNIESLLPDATIIRNLCYSRPKVMLDFLIWLELYEVETKVLNQSVKTEY